MKRKGTSAERDLLHKFWKENIPAARVAGSGSMRYPSPDIIAGTPVRKLVIECKTIKDDKLYIPKSEIEDLKKFGSMFGAEPWIAVKFSNGEWFFVMPEDLKETPASYSIDKELVKTFGMIFEEILFTFKNPDP